MPSPRPIPGRLANFSLALLLSVEPLPGHVPRSGLLTPPKLVRVYLELERVNFHPTTGQRLFDDLKHRPYHTLDYLPAEHKISLQTHIPSHTPLDGAGYMLGIEDEYIPGLDFGDVLRQWEPRLRSPLPMAPRLGLSGMLPLGLLKGMGRLQPPPLVAGSMLSITGLYDRLATPKIPLDVDLTQWHAQVPPIEVVKLNNRLLKRAATVPAPLLEHRKPNGDVDYDAIYAKLPKNFNELPFLQRRKTFLLLELSGDYSQFSLYMKKLHKQPRRLRESLLALNPEAKLLVLLPSVRRAPPPVKRDVDERGAIVLNHELGRIIGCGAWGFVRECVGDGTTRAMKIVRTKNALVHAHFRKEIQIWSRLQHPHILPLLDVLETENAIFCLTPRMYGGTLFDVVQNWGFYSSPVMSISHADRCNAIRAAARQTVAALEYMHELGIVHGDVKLENCLVEDGHGDERGELKVILCDFGMLQFYSHRLLRRPLLSKSWSSSQLARQRSWLLRHPGLPETAFQLRPGSKRGSVLKEAGRVGSLLKEAGRVGSFGGASVASIPQHLLAHLPGPELPASPVVGISSLRKPFGPAPTSTQVFQPQWWSHGRTHLYLVGELYLLLGPNLRPRLPLEGTLPWVGTMSRDPLLQLFLDMYQNLNNTDAVVAHDTEVDADLPHLHIGSLPYAAPELLLPQPPPLGPSADVWAFGCMVYTMAVGKLPFQHSYEPRLRAIILAGRFDRDSLDKATEGADDIRNAICGCLDTDITRRWDLLALKGLWT